MKKLKSISWLLSPWILSCFWLWKLGGAIEAGEQRLPPPGKFFSPAVGMWWNAMWVDRSTPEALSLEGVQGEVYFDERMVPHIFAEGDHQAFFIQGYVHAMHRLWQMDFSARAGEGRLSEVVGPAAVEFDRLKRRKGLAEAARQSVEHWKQDSFLLSRLEAYVRGVNARINQMRARDLPIEYKLLDYAPEPWSLFRSALYHKSMAEILCGRDKDIEMNNARAFFKQDFARLFPELDSLTDPVIPRGTDWAGIPPMPQLEAGEASEVGFLPFSRDQGPAGLGSNNWAVGPWRSRSGNPILCNDPHLTLTLPSIWYEQQIATPEYRVYGVSFPGIPGVIVGFNDSIAWGVTNAGWDVLDWYRVEWKDASMSHYRLDGEWKLTNVRLDTIRIRGGGYLVDSVRLSHWGPVLYTDPAHRRYGLAMHWIIQHPPEQQEYRTFMTMNRARNYDGYREACTHFPYPAQNFAFASATGDIALTLGGNMPLKRDQQGRFVADGSISGNGWQGFLEPRYNPQVHNPERGFISSANQRTTDDAFPVYYNDGDFRAFRGTLINRYLGQRSDWGVEDMMRLQYNAYSLKAEISLPYLLASLDTSALDDRGRLIARRLQTWDLVYDSSSVEAVWYDRWFEVFQRLVWDEVLDTPAVARPGEVATMELLRRQPESPWFDLRGTALREGAPEIARMAFDSLLSFDRQQEERQDWARYRNAAIQHLARIPAFSESGIRSPGNEDLINAHARVFGPSWRMIVELTPKGPRAYGVYPGGQEGQPGSRHYIDMIDHWSKGKYYELHFWREPPAVGSFTHKLKFQSK
ncbi:MAG: penicillin acylase family protein [Saprospiraceae bacterium]|nr:penicillin acylase family protein [Saprospiraceae bacterium]